MNTSNNLRMTLKAALDNLWSRIQGIFSGLDDRVTALEQGGTGVSGVKGNAENSYRQGNVNLTPANLGLVRVDGQATNPYGSFSVNGIFKWGDICVINIAVNLSGAIAGVNGRVCDIPAAFCPSGGDLAINGFATYGGVTNAIVTFRVTSTGTLITSQGASQVSGQIRLNSTYILI